MWPRSTPWYPHLEGILKFNVDGSSRGKPVQAEIRGVLRNSEGEVLLMFSKNIGVCDSNEAEVLAILKGLKLFSTRYGVHFLSKEIPLIRLLGCPTKRLIYGDSHFILMKLGNY